MKLKFKFNLPKSLANYWDKDKYQQKANIINIKSIIIIFLFLETGGFFIGNYLINILGQVLKALANSSITVDYGIRSMFQFLKQHNSYRLIWLILETFMVSKFCIKLYIAHRNNNPGHKGVQRWTTEEEIIEQYTSVPTKTQEYDANPGIPVYRIDDTFYIDNSPVNNLILGMTRSGKGETLVFPMIDIYSRSKKKPSIICSDPKLELYISSKETLEKRGYNVYLINLGDPEKGSGYNPLTLIIEFYKLGEYGTAEMLCKTFAHTIFTNVKNPTKDEFFSKTATTLLCALIWAHMEDCISEDDKMNMELKRKCAESDIEYKPIYANTRKITLYSIVNLFLTLATETISGDKSVLDAYFNDRPAGNKAKLFFAASGIAGDKTKGSIYATAFSEISIFSMEKNAKMLAESSINLIDVGFGDKPMAIFIGIPDTDTSNHFLATTFISQLYFAISNEATKRNGKCTREVHFILDEFGNLPSFSSIDSWITVCLGRRIRFNLFIQSYSQLESKYGKEVANTIIGNCGNQIYILVDDTASAESYSKLIGNKTVKIITRNKKPLSLEVTENEHFENRPLLDYSELMNFTEGEYVVVRAMKRKDNSGKDITSYPIYSTGKHKAIPRYKYLLDDFPQNRTLNDAKTDDRSNINLRARMVDAGKWVDMKKYAPLLNYSMEDVFYTEIDKAFDHAEILSKLYTNLSYGMDFPKLTVGKYLEIMREIYANSIISTQEYQTLTMEVLNKANSCYEAEN